MTIDICMRNGMMRHLLLTEIYAKLDRFDVEVTHGFQVVKKPFGLTWETYLGMFHRHLTTSSTFILRAFSLLKNCTCQKCA